MVRSVVIGLSESLLAMLQEPKTCFHYLTGLRILVAEDETNTANQYKIALEARGHRVLLKTNGQDCMNTYRAAVERMTRSWSLKAKGNHKSSASPFDVVILDYRMPVKDGLEVAKEIFVLNPKQRIIFASAYVIETLTESIRELGQVVEFLQKPFGIDSLTDAVEDKGIYEELEKIKVRSFALMNSNPTHAQLVDLLAGMKMLEKQIRGNWQTITFDSILRSACSLRDERTLVSRNND